MYRDKLQKREKKKELILFLPRVIASIRLNEFSTTFFFLFLIQCGTLTIRLSAFDCERQYTAGVASVEIVVVKLF